MHLHWKLFQSKMDARGSVHSAFVQWLREERKKEGEGINAGEHRFMLKMTQLVQLWSVLVTHGFPLRLTWGDQTGKYSEGLDV